MKTWVEISKKNLLHNVGQFLSLLKKRTKFMAVIKSNAYGHDLSKVVEILSKKDKKYWFGVDSVDEAEIARKAANKNPILVLGYTPNNKIEQASKINVHVTIYNWETLNYLKKIKPKINVHIKVETGTARQGILDKDVVKYTKELSKIPNVKIAGISTHFANIEETNDISYSQAQIARYNAILELLRGVNAYKHITCSAGALLRPETHCDMVRVGLGLYGLWPSESIKEKSKKTLKPVLVWKTIVAQVKTIPQGSPVGYDLTEYTKRDSKIAILPIGYWDGYDRGLSSIGRVLIKGKSCKILGRVCMNMCAADVTDIKDVKPDDEVVLLGGGISAEKIARLTNTINYEVVTRINPLIKRIVV